MIKNVKDFLKSLRIFNAWPDNLIDKICGHAEILLLEKGQNLSSRLEDLNDIFILEAGQIEPTTPITSHNNQIVKFINSEVIC